MVFERKPVLINGAFGAGRHYVTALLAEALAGEASLVDGLPRGGEIVPNGVIRHNHVMVGRFPFHVPLEEFAVYMDDAEYADYGHVFLIRDLRDLLISAWNFRCNYAGGALGPESHGHQESYAEALQAFGSNEESILAFMEQGDRYGFVPFDRFVEGALHFFEHPRVHVFSYEGFAINPILGLRNFCSAFGYPCSAQAAHRAVGKVPRTGRLYRWVPYFTERIEQRFKQVAGEALVQMGYATDNDWTRHEFSGVQSGGADARMPIETLANAQHVDQSVIEAAYRIFYERALEGSEALRFHMDKLGGGSVGELRRAFLASEEYVNKFAARDARERPDP